MNAERARAENDVQAIVTRQSYYSMKVFMLATDLGMWAYIPERPSPKQGRWSSKDPAEKRVVLAKPNRTQRSRCKALSRLPSELAKRSFAHVCDTAEATRTLFRGLASVATRDLPIVAAQNLSTIMRMLCGIGSPRALRGLRALLQLTWTAVTRLVSALGRLLAVLVGHDADRSQPFGRSRSVSHDRRKAARLLPVNSLLTAGRFDLGLTPRYSWSNSEKQRGVPA